MPKMKAGSEDLVIRPVQESDLDGLITLLETVPDSITSLQPDRDYLDGKIHQSLRSFYPVITEPGPEKYFFVLEDCDHDRLAGTCSIYAKTGGYEPSYTYEILENVFRHEPLDIETTIPELNLKIEHEGPSELGGLFLHSDYRGGGVGGDLSRSRILFAKAFPERFTKKIMTEFRGVVTEEGEVPFWEAIGRHFFVHDFFSLDQASAISRKDFIHDLMPRHPIYIPLLPQEAQDVIGKPHPATEPAVNVLEKEGFRYLKQVDIFDAGPIYEAKLAKTNSFLKSRELKVSQVVKSLPKKEIKVGLLANRSLDFRAAPGSVSIHDDEAKITEKLAATLQVEPGQDILFLSHK